MLVIVFPHHPKDPYICNKGNGVVGKIMHLLGLGQLLGIKIRHLDHACIVAPEMNMSTVTLKRFAFFVG